ncbi:MAG: hypothetical protein U0Q16_00850 [Bryobacteraceae bacterium]
MSRIVIAPSAAKAASTPLLPAAAPSAPVAEVDVKPAIPETIQETGIADSLIEQMILKVLYYRSETLGRDLARALGLKFSVIEEMVEFLKRQHLVTVKKSLGLGNLTAVYALTDAGRTLAREYLEASQYAGQVPVPLAQYVRTVMAQKRSDDWLKPEMVREAFKHMVVTPQLISQIGPAVCSGKSFLLYGAAGNGKTYLVEALFDIDPTPIFIPYAIEAQGQIIQVFDPLYHKPVETPEKDSVMAFAADPPYDQRWVKVKRPSIVTGGELTLDMLDLSYNEVSKFYDAPMQLKANNGIYLLDDFGRQKASPAEVLNRWIVPMERRLDYLTFRNGTKMQVPFECFLVFSSNLKPEQLGDEAFLRRIQYKMLMRNPDENEFYQIFDGFCRQKELPYERSVFERFLKTHYRDTGKPRRRCHPRDIISHAIDTLRFENLPFKLTDVVLDHAFESCFVSHEDEG